MKKRTGRSLVGVVLALGITILGLNSTFSADDDDKQATMQAQQDVLKLADALEKGGDTKAKAEAIHKKYEELKPVMNIFKPRAKGGLGVGPRGPADGIELRIKSWGGKKPLKSGDLKTWSEEIVRAGNVTRAMARVTEEYTPKKNPEGWKKYAKDMGEAAEDWVNAARAGDAARFKKASNNLDASCAGCHSDYRD